MSSSGSQNLLPEVPQRARQVASNKPDVRERYETVSAEESGYDNQNRDLADLIEDASDDDQVVDVGSGTYEMSGVDLGGDVCGIVGDGSESCTINCETGGGYLFDINAETPVIEGVTIQASGDVALANVQTGDEGWIEDVVFRGQRDKYGANGERFTFLIEADSGATNFIHRVSLPDGGTNHSGSSKVGHAIGPNADPGHEGYNVWKEVYCEDFRDNGFYVAHSPGPNILWNCTAINNAAGNIRLGNDDVVIGGYSEVSDLPSGRRGKPLESDTGSDIRVVGLHMYGEGTAVGSAAQVIQLRSDFESMELDRCIVHGNDVNYLARLDEGDVTITDGWWLHENDSTTAVQVGGRGNPATVTADSDWKLRTDNATEISGPVTIDGTRYSGTTTASEAGLGDPEPFPALHFGDGGGDGDGDGDGGGNETPRFGYPVYTALQGVHRSFTDIATTLDS